MLGLVPGVKNALISASIWKKKDFQAYWGHGGCWGCRGQCSWKCCWGKKISQITNPKHYLYFLRSKRQSRSLKSLRLSWLMRSLRPVRSSGSRRYLNSYSKWLKSCNFATWKRWNHGLNLGKFKVENGILQNGGYWGYMRLKKI